MRGDWERRGTTGTVTIVPDGDEPPMENAPLPPHQHHRSSPGASWRRWLPALLAGIVVLALATALAVSVLGGSGSDPSDVVKLDPNGTLPPGLPDSSDDPVGQRIGALQYTTFDGRTVDLATDGKPLLLNFWSSTCAPCVREMPALDQVWRANRDRVDVLGLDYVEAPELGQAMAARTDVQYPIARDAKGTLLRRFGGTGLPYTVLIGADGTVLAVHAGELDAAGFQRLIDTAAGR
ncbi:MAG: TlpA family protein disulfide reductase [Acidimicrobiia bacterium]|nr:TlpA family protein disulfide reductase [Acidimicrobiia bacterium]